VRTGRRPRVWLCCLVAVVGTSPLLLPAAPASGTAREALDLALDYFLVADYRTSLDRLSAVLDGRGLTDEGLVQAHVLRARALVGLGRTESAVAAFCGVLRLDGEWRPAPGLSAEELVAFRRAVPLSLPPVAPPPRGRAALSPVTAPWLHAGGMLGLGSAKPVERPWYRRPLLIGVAGGVAAGVLLLVLDEGGPEEAARLPDFPEPPE
jgi:hypothetical protein